MNKFMKTLEIFGWLLFGITVLAVVSSLCLIFIPHYEYYAPTQELDQIEKIKVRYVDWEKEEIFDWGEIPPEKHQEFISELSQIPMSYHTPPATGVEGLTYQIEYSNGEYEMVSSWVTYYSATDSESGSYDFDREPFEALWEKYGNKYED